jgi:chemotaxis protein MotB
VSRVRGPGGTRKTRARRGGPVPKGNHLKTVNRILLGLTLLAASPAMTGCASSQALRASLNERDAEVAELAAENSHLIDQLARARSDRDGLQAALTEASSRMLARPEPARAVLPATPRFADLEDAGIGVGRRGDAIVFTVPSAVTFASGKSELTSGGRKALTTLAGRLKSGFPADSVFYVEGHTDSDPIKKSGFKTNRDLSWARARAVHQFLVAECRIADDRFVVSGHGPHRQLESNSTKAGKARNRRVEVLVRAAE